MRRGYYDGFFNRPTAAWRAKRRFSLSADTDWSLAADSVSQPWFTGRAQAQAYQPAAQDAAAAPAAGELAAVQPGVLSPAVPPLPTPPLPDGRDLILTDVAPVDSDLLSTMLSDRLPDALLLPVQPAAAEAAPLPPLGELLTAAPAAQPLPAEPVATAPAAEPAASADPAAPGEPTAAPGAVEAAPPLMVIADRVFADAVDTPRGPYLDLAILAAGPDSSPPLEVFLIG